MEGPLHLGAERGQPALSTPLGRSRFWALSAKEADGVIHFVEPRGRTGKSPIEGAVKDQLYVVRYFGRLVTFELAPDDVGTGTDLTLTAGDTRTRPDDVGRLGLAAAAVEGLGRLRCRSAHHDEDRTWWHGYTEGS